MAEGETFGETRKAAAPDEAIILLGHGSRVPEAGKDMERVAARLRQKYGYPLVEVCFMSRLGPHFPEVFEKCVNLGATKVLVIPYFLHSGLHLVLDLPEMLQEQARRFPAVTLQMGRGFGFDETAGRSGANKDRGDEEFQGRKANGAASKGNVPCPARAVRVRSHASGGGCKVSGIGKAGYR